VSSRLGDIDAFFSRFDRELTGLWCCTAAGCSLLMQYIVRSSISGILLLASPSLQILQLGGEVSKTFTFYKSTNIYCRFVYNKSMVEVVEKLFVSILLRNQYLLVSPHFYPVYPFQLGARVSLFRLNQNISQFSHSSGGIKSSTFSRSSA